MATITNLGSAEKVSSNVSLPFSSISVIIPAYNDETTIDKLVADSDALLRNLCRDYEIIVINDGSKDKTLQVLQNLAKTTPRLKVINHEVNQGFGATIRELYLTGSKEVIFSLPGDYQYHPKELLKMAQGLHGGDLVIGRRVKRNDPTKRLLQSHVYNAMMRLLYGAWFTDVNSIKLFRKCIFDEIQLLSKTPFVDAELCIRTERAGFRVVEIDIEHLPRLSQGASGGKFSVIWETFSDLIKMRSKI